MKELLQLLLEEAEAEERACWYESGYEVEDRALQALQNVIRRAQARLEEEK
jgi:hypothetical protein